MEEHKFYWLKLKRDFFKRHDIRIVEEMPNGKDYILFYLKMLVESVDHEGELRFSDTIPYNEDMLATITNTNIDIVRAAMKIFTELQMIEIIEDGTIFMTEVHKMIGSASNTDSANRQRRSREQLKSIQKRSTVTKCNAHVTVPVTKHNESKSIDIEKEIDIESDINIYKKGDAKRSTVPPDPNDILDYFKEFISSRGLTLDPYTEAERFDSYYTERNWYTGDHKMQSWKASAANWILNSNSYQRKNSNS